MCFLDLNSAPKFTIVIVSLRTFDSGYNKWGVFADGKFSIVCLVSLSDQLVTDTISVAILQYPTVTRLIFLLQLRAFVVCNHTIFQK